MPSLNNVLDWDRYSYVRNNALKYNDPSGHLLCSPVRPCEPVTLTNPPKPTNDKMGLPDVTITSGTPPYNPTVTPSIDELLPVYPGRPTSTNEPFFTEQYPENNHELVPIVFVEIDWSMVDKVDLTIDGIGIASDIGTLAGIPHAQAVGITAELIGLGKSVVELVKGDPQSLFLQQVTDQAQRAAVVVFRLERIVPLLGLIGNGVSIYFNVGPATTITLNE